jgi:hypothetical protein
MLPLTNCTSNADESEKRVPEAAVTFKHHHAEAMTSGAIFVLTFFDSPFIYRRSIRRTMLSERQKRFENGKNVLKTTRMF